MSTVKLPHGVAIGRPHSLMSARVHCGMFVDNEGLKHESFAEFQW